MKTVLKISVQGLAVMLAYAVVAFGVSWLLTFIGFGFFDALGVFAFVVAFLSASGLIVGGVYLVCLAVGFVWETVGEWLDKRFDLG